MVFSDSTRAVKRSATSRTLLPIGPTVSKDFEDGTTPFTETIPVVGLIEYRDALIAGAVMEASVSAPTPIAARPALMAMETPEDEPPGTYALRISKFPFPGDK